jgi:hypothetical protein
VGGKVLRKALDTYKKKIDENHHILFSYNIAIDRLEFLVDENLLKFFDETNELVNFIILQLRLAIDDVYSIGLNQSFFHGFESLLSVIRANYYSKEEFLKVFAQFDSTKTSYEEIENFAKKHGLEDYELSKELGFTKNIEVDYEILDLRYI